MPSRETTRRLSGTWHIEYQYSMGSSAAEFFDRLSDRVLLGSACHGCDRVSAPPKGFCEYCFKEIDELVELGHSGEIEAATIVTAPFAGSLEVPYCVAYVRLDGATSSIANIVRGIDLSDPTTFPAEIQIGSRVDVRFTDTPTNRVTDFWFVPAEPTSPPSETSA